MTPQQVKENIKKLLNEKKLSEREVSLKLGKNPAYINQFLTRPSPLRLTEKDRGMLSKILDVPEHDLTDLPIKVGSTDIPKEELLELVSLLTSWASDRNKILTAQKGLELAYMIYDDVKDTPVAEKKAKVYNIADFAYRHSVVNQ